MKRRILIVICAVILLSTTAALVAGCGGQTESREGKLTVAVSITPEAAFVEKVAGDLVDIVTIIPSGNSPANYQPTTTEMQALSDASVYFVMQVPAETANILPKVTDFNSDIVIVNLRDAVSADYPMLELGEHSHDEDEAEETESDDGADPHIWLSPKRVYVMVKTIRDTLSKMDPENANVYQQNANAYLLELEALDEAIKGIVAGMDNKAFMIYHGAYSYFADDYGLTMISLEVDGKSAPAAVMAAAIEQAKAEQITRIFYQDEFDDHQANTVAEEIGGVVMKARPLAYDYVASLREFAAALADGE